jgi:hypothetical protein
MSSKHLRRLYQTLFVLLLAQPAVLADSHMDAGWFYMVKSRPSAPAREDEYNSWYEDIDIPDVLAVPGFMRARRAIARDSTETLPTDANYAAFYDIDTPDIDKSIIDLYVAARKMSQLGRLTDVLKVVEANYYQLLKLDEPGAQSETGPGISYVFTQKILCCENPSVRSEFLDWYGAALAPAIIESLGATRSQLYELYRIMEVVALTPEEVPHFLIVLEVTSDSAADLVTRFDALLAELDRTENFAGGDRVVYEVISEKFSP